MTKQIKAQIRNIAITLLAWIFAAVLFSLIRLYGVEEEEFFAAENTGVNIEGFILLQGLVVGVAFGLGFGLLDFLLEGKWLRKFSYWVVVLFEPEVM